MNLFDDNKLNSLGSDIDTEFCRLIRPFMQKWIAEGCNIRELAHVMQGALQAVELEEVLGW
jgi:hypothetical protein